MGELQVVQAGARSDARMATTPRPSSQAGLRWLEVQEPQDG